MAVKIVFEGDGLSYKTDTTIVKATQVIAFLNAEIDMAKRNEKLPSQILTSLPIQKESPAELIEKYGAETNPQKIAVFTFFVKNQSGANTINQSEIKNLFKRSGAPVPMNLGRDIKDAIRLGYLSFDIDKPDEYYLTIKGEKTLMDGFTSKTKLIRRNGGIGQRTGKKREKIRDEVKNLNIKTTLESFPNLHSLGKASQILWILVFADNNKITSLSRKEIIDLAEKMKIGIKSSNLAGNSESSFKRGFIQLTGEGNYQILQTGIDYLKGQGK